MQSGCNTSPKLNAIPVNIAMPCRPRTNGSRELMRAFCPYEVALLNRFVLPCAAALVSFSCIGQTPTPAPASKSPVNISVYDRTRLDVFQWFTATPNAETYGYLESLLRVGVAQQRKAYDWELELTQPSELFLPSDAVSPVSAQGQLGLAAKHLAMRSDLHFLQLTSDKDLWYQGGGAYDTQVFGFVGRPANLHSSFPSVFDLSADYEVSKNISLTAYYAHAWGKRVIAAIYPVGPAAQFGYRGANRSGPRSSLGSGRVANERRSKLLGRAVGPSTHMHGYHGISPPVSRNFPVTGESRRAARTISAAPSSTV